MLSLVATDSFDFVDETSITTSHGFSVTCVYHGVAMQGGAVGVGAPQLREKIMGLI